MCGVMLYRSALEDLLAALSEPTRLAALGIIWDGQEHCVCELLDRLSASQSRMSRHMARLKTVGLLMDRRDAQWVRYRCNPDIPVAWVAIIDAVFAAKPMAALGAASSMEVSPGGVEETAHRSRLTRQKVA